jgi:hypothetical protein
VERSAARTRTTLPQTNRRLPVLGPTEQLGALIPRPWPSSQEEFGEVITNTLVDILWNSVMTEDERESLMMEAGGLQGANNRPSIAYEKWIEKLDALILKEAVTFGWRISVSKMVQRRFLEWEVLPDGPERFERFGKACARATRISQKKEPPPIDDPGLRRSKLVAVPELRLLLRSLRDEFSTARTRPTAAVILERFAATVTAEPETFDYLYKTLKWWKRFFEEEEGSSSIKALVSGQRLSPAALFDTWMGRWKGRDADSIRQQVSRMAKI